MAKKNKDKNKGKGGPAAEGGDDATARRRVSLLRHKLTKAMEDPLTRDQIVRAIRGMLNEDKGR